MRTTNSSTSSSDPAGAAGTGSWATFSCLLVSVAVVATLALVAILYAVDPYDSGRSGLAWREGVPPQGPRTAAASRGRDPRFHGAIFGNSHIQLISPERLRAATGIPFVQLSVPGSGPQEQLTLIEWYLRHRRQPAEALVIAADQQWCTADPALPVSKPFPFWLFSSSPVEYTRGLVRMDVLEELPRRLAFILNPDAERARPDGYWDYEHDEATRAHGSSRKDMEPDQRPSDDWEPDPTGRFPAADRLLSLMAELPSDLAVVLVFPPNHISLLPRDGTARHRADQQCKAALRGAISHHARAAVVDWRKDRAENRISDLYLDPSHYRQPLARRVEDEVVEALHRMRQP